MKSEKGELSEDARTKYSEAAEVLNKIQDLTKKKKDAIHFEIAALELGQGIEEFLYSAAACDITGAFAVEQFMVNVFGMEDALNRMGQHELQHEFTRAMWNSFETIPNMLIENCGCKEVKPKGNNQGIRE